MHNATAASSGRTADGRRRRWLLEAEDLRMASEA